MRGRGSRRELAVWRPWSRSYLGSEAFHRGKQAMSSWGPADLTPYFGTLGPPSMAETTQRGGGIWEGHRNALKEKGNPQGHWSRAGHRTNTAHGPEPHGQVGAEVFRMRGRHRAFPAPENRPGSNGEGGVSPSRHGARMHQGKAQRGVVGEPEAGGAETVALPQATQEMGEIGGLLCTQNFQFNQSGGWRRD